MGANHFPQLNLQQGSVGVAEIAHPTHQLILHAPGIDVHQQFCKSKTTAGTLREKCDWLDQVLQASISKTCPNIFMSVEWLFFDFCGERGGRALDKNGFLTSLTLILNLSRQYPDVLMIPGTILWYIEDAGWKYVLNTLPVVRNGQLLHIYQKKVNSHDVDAKEEQQGWCFLTMQDDVKERVLAYSSNIFSCDNLTYGFEVCADHGGRIGINNYIKYCPLGLGVDFHGLTSCGSGLKPSSLFTRDKAIFFHVDHSDNGMMQCYQVKQASGLDIEQYQAEQGNLSGPLPRRIEVKVNTEVAPHCVLVKTVDVSPLAPLSPQEMDTNLQKFGWRRVELPRRGVDSLFLALYADACKLTSPEQWQGIDLENIVREQRQAITAHFEQLMQELDTNFRGLIFATPLNCTNIAMFLEKIRLWYMFPHQKDSDAFKACLRTPHGWDELFLQVISCCLTRDIVLFQTLKSRPVRVIAFDFTARAPTEARNPLMLVFFNNTLHFDWAYKET